MTKNANFTSYKYTSFRRYYDNPHSGAPDCSRNLVQRLYYEMPVAIPFGNGPYRHEGLKKTKPEGGNEEEVPEGSYYRMTLILRVRYLVGPCLFSVKK